MLPWAGMRRSLAAALLLCALPASAKKPSLDVTKAVAAIVAAPEAPPKELLEAAIDAWRCAAERGEVTRPLATVIDYSRPSTEKRLWVLDLEKGEVLWHELVAHGKGTGENLATRFSNEEGSRQSSLGAFSTLGTYVGDNGYSLRLRGLERGVNDNAEERAIVMHGAWYVDESLGSKQGRIGRSWGCPAVRDEISRDLIDRIQGGSLVLAWHPDEAWRKKSRYVNGCK